MEHKPKIDLVFVFFLVSTVLFIPLLAQDNILKALLLVFLILIVFIALIFPGGIWLLATITLFVGTLLPYNFHLVKYYPEHFGGVWPHPIISPTYLAVFFSLILILIFYSKKIKNILYIKLDTIFLSWFLFSIYSFIISIFSAYSITASFYEFIQMMIALYIYIYITFMIDTPEKVNKLFVAIGILLILESSIAILQYVKILPLDLFAGEGPTPLEIGFITQIFRRVTGTLREPNMFGKLLSIYLPIFFVSSLINKGRIKVFSIIISIFASIALLMTLSRSAIIGTILAIAFILFFINKYAPEFTPSKKVLLSSVGIIIISITTGLIFLAQILYLRFIAFGLLTASERFAQYENAIHLIKNHFFSGVGLNNYYFRIMLEDFTGSATAYPQYVVHNIYLLYFAETGILGFILFTFFIISIFYQNLKTLESKALQPFPTAIIIGGISGFISLSIQGLVDWGFRSVNMYHLIFLLGLMYSIKNPLEERHYE